MNAEIMNELKGRLITYLAQSGIKNTSSMFTCITGKHSDSTPSCHVVRASKGITWYCFGCNVGGDIFTAAHYLEGLPIEGPDFWKVTVPAIAKKFGVDYAETELTPEDRERYQMLAAYRDAATYVTSCLENPKSVVHKYLEKRKYSVETAKALSIGTIDSYDGYLDFMKSNGWSREYLLQASLLDDRIFNSNNLIFVVKDIDGRPIAFAARNMMVEKHKEEGKGSRYINSPATIIYPKGATLYGLDECLDIDGPLWIVEGYPDRVALWQAGIKKVAAIGGTAFTSLSETHKAGNNHLDILMEHDLTNIILCLDGDDMGVFNTSKIIDEHLIKAPTLNVRVCNIPKDADDPDKYISEHGLEEFRKFPLMSPFAWKLEHLEYNADPKDTADKMIPLIAQETNPTSQWEMCRVLSSKTNIPIDFISQAVLNITSGAKSKTEQQVLGIGKDLQKKLYGATDPESLMTMVGDMYGKMLTVMEENSEEGRKKKADYDSKITSMKGLILSEDTQFRLQMGKFKQIEESLGGFPTDAQLMILTGFANIGKTSILRNLAWEMIRANPNVHIVFMSIDDSFQKLLNGFVSIVTNIPMNMVCNKSMLDKHAAVRESVIKGFDELVKLKDRMVVKGDEDGMTTYAVENHIKEAIKNHPDKKVVFFLDNFHRLSDIDSGKVEEIDLTLKRLKRVFKRYNVPGLVNVELKKTEWASRATMRDIKGSGAFEFYADLVWIFHQTFHSDKYTHLTWNNGGRKSPINELETAKNKISSFKESIFLKFFDNQSRFDEMTKAEIIPIIEKEKERLRSRGGGFNGKRTGASGGASSVQQPAVAADDAGGSGSGHVRGTSGSVS